MATQGTPMPRVAVTRNAESVVLDLLDLPYVRATTFQERPTKRRPDPPIGHAVIINGARRQVEVWCHDVDASDPPCIYHRTEADAWACFDKHHPGVREAIAAVDAMRNDDSRADAS